MNSSGVAIFGATPSSRLRIGGTRSGTSWTTSGALFCTDPGTLTDTTGSGTINIRVANSFDIPTLASTNAVSIANAATLYVAGANTTITNGNALYVAGGTSYFGGNVGIGTTTPLSATHIEGTATANNGVLYVKDLGTDDTRGHIVIEGNSSATAAWSGIDMMTSPSSGTAHKWRMVARSETASSLPGNLTFWQNNGSWLNRMTLNAAGNVGFGGESSALSKVAVRGSLSVGSSTYSAVAAPTNGAIIEGNVGIGTTSPGASSILDISSTTKGLVLPRMTKTQRDAIVSPVAGMAIYQTDNTPGLRVYNGTNWMKFTETAD
jgi:hypothetical protein